MYSRNYRQLSQKTHMLLMKASALLPDLLTPAAVASDLTCHCKAFQSWRRLLEVTKTQPTKHTHKHPRHLVDQLLLVANQLLLLYQGKLRKVTDMSSLVLLVSEKSGD